VGRNVQLCCERFSITLADATSSLFSVRAIDDMCRDKVDDDAIRNVERIIELVRIRDNILQLPSPSNVLVCRTSGTLFLFYVQIDCVSVCF